MTTLASDTFDFAYPYNSIEQFHTDQGLTFDLDFDLAASPPALSSGPSTPPTEIMSLPASSSTYPFDPSLFSSYHGRSASLSSSVYSFTGGASSTIDSTPGTASTRLSTTPPRAVSSTPIIRNHGGPILLPKIRPQDQDLQAATVAATIPKKRRANKAAASAATTTPPAKRQAVANRRPQVHQRSYTNPETLKMAYAHLGFGSSSPLAMHQSRKQQQQQQQQEEESSFSNSLLCSPVSFIQDWHPPSATTTRRTSSHAGIETVTIDTAKYPFPPYRQLTYPTATAQEDFLFPNQYVSVATPRGLSPLSQVSQTAAPELTAVAPAVAAIAGPTTTLGAYLAEPNPTTSLVRTINYAHREPGLKHYWWDIRSVRPWTSFSSAAVSATANLLASPVPHQLLPTPPAFSTRHPETEAQLYSLYTSYYIPKLNAALAVTSQDAVQLSVPSPAPPAPKSGKASSGGSTSSPDMLIVARAPSDESSATMLFGGRPTSRAVGLVRSFERFNTGMRSEGNIKKVEYLRGLAAVHHHMREYGTRYGFIMTEIELVLVRNGTHATPNFGELEVLSMPLGESASSEEGEGAMTACTALFALLCHVAASGDDEDDGALMHQEYAGATTSWRADIGAPAQGTRRKTLPREDWIPQPQLAEKREAKRSRGWVWPEDAVGRKELGKRGVKYAGVR